MFLLFLSNAGHFQYLIMSQLSDLNVSEHQLWPYQSLQLAVLRLHCQMTQWTVQQLCSSVWSRNPDSNQHNRSKRNGFITLRLWILDSRHHTTLNHSVTKSPSGIITSVHTWNKQRGFQESSFWKMTASFTTTTDNLIESTSGTAVVTALLICSFTDIIYMSRLKQTTSAPFYSPTPWLLQCYSCWHQSQFPSINSTVQYSTVLFQIIALFCPLLANCPCFLWCHFQTSVRCLPLWPCPVAHWTFFQHLCFLKLLAPLALVLLRL